MLFKVSVLRFLFFISLLMGIGCTKTMSEKGADMMSGLYKGTMTAGGTSYPEYIIKVEKSSKQQVRISCVSTPKLFDSFEFAIHACKTNVSNFIALR